MATVEKLAQALAEVRQQLGEAQRLDAMLPRRRCLKAQNKAKQKGPRLWACLSVIVPPPKTNECGDWSAPE